MPRLRLHIAFNPRCRGTPSRLRLKTSMTRRLMLSPRPLRVKGQRRQIQPSFILQVLLDRAGASPGVIDGFYGENVVERRLPASRSCNASRSTEGPTFEMLFAFRTIGRLSVHTSLHRMMPLISSRTFRSDYAKQAKMTHLGYTSVAERLSERFHMDIDLLKALNPGAHSPPAKRFPLRSSVRREREGQAYRSPQEKRRGAGLCGRRICSGSLPGNDRQRRQPLACGPAQGKRCRS